MKIATWNINSVRARTPLLCQWLRAHQPDALCIQETKVEDHDFPREPIEDEGYNIAAFGEKSYNGVAVATRWPIDDVVRGLPDDGAKRVLACRVRDVVLINVYVPNGQDVGTDRYAHKLDWLARLRAFLTERLAPAAKLVVAGDFNVTFDDRDVWDPEGYREQIHCSTPERDALRAIVDLGLHDALRRFHQGPGAYTWWDYRGGAFERNQGLRIDHMLLSAAALAACTGVEIHVDARAQRNASDHAPVLAAFAEPA